MFGNHQHVLWIIWLHVGFADCLIHFGCIGLIGDGSLVGFGVLIDFLRDASFLFLLRHFLGCEWRIAVESEHAHHLVVAVVVESHASHTGGSSSHEARSILVEEHSPTVSVGQEDVLVAVGQSHIHDFVALHQFDGVESVVAWV